MTNNIYVVAATINGKSKVYFTGTYAECQQYMLNTPDPWYESDNASIHLKDAWEEYAKELYVVASSIGGWNQNPIFSGTYEECAKYMEDNPCLGYGNDNTAIYLAEEWEVDYI